jgi:hypothetical protein
MTVGDVATVVVGNDASCLASRSAGLTVGVVVLGRWSKGGS